MRKSQLERFDLYMCVLSNLSKQQIVTQKFRASGRNPDNLFWQNKGSRQPAPEPFSSVFVIYFLHLLPTVFAICRLEFLFLRGDPEENRETPKISIKTAPK